MARLLARRHGLRWYGADAHTWKHRDRAIAAGHRAAIRWEALPREERWSAPEEELLAMSLHHERGAMIAEDVRALPPSPPTVVEGTPVTPRFAGPRALWLLPTPEVQRRRLAERGLEPGPLALYRHLVRVIEAEVEEYGGAVLRVDGERGVAETLAEVEGFFAGELSGVRTAEGRRGLLRYANGVVAEQYRGFLGRAWAPRAGLVARFACECASPVCEEDVPLDPLAYPPPLPLLAHGHAAPPNASAV
ncbi:hypothetical protein [Streptomyces sp. NPDC001889]